MQWRMTAVCAVLVAAAGLARAATNAQDTAETYTGWTTGSTGTGVTGLGTWVLETTSTNLGDNGHFIGNATGNAAGTNQVPDTDINTADKAWGMYANSGQTAAAWRSLEGGPLVVGQAFSLAMDNGYEDGGSAVGFGLQNASGQSLVEVMFRGGQTNYEVNTASGLQELPFGYSSDGVKVTLTLTSFTTFTGTIEPWPSGAAVDFSGSLMNPSGGQLITRLRLFNFNAGGGSDHDQFFNSIVVSEAPTNFPSLPAPAITAVGVTNGSHVITWSATNAAIYDLESSTNLLTGPWATSLATSGLVTPGVLMTVTNIAGTPAFYRVTQRQM